MAQRTPTGDGPIRVATYIRACSNEEHHRFAEAAQTRLLESHISNQPGWVLARQYSDRMSGGTLNRPGLQRALADARAGSFDVLLVPSLDRLTRSLGDLARIVRELEAAHVIFRSAAEVIASDTTFGRLVIQLISAFAEFERGIPSDQGTTGTDEGEGAGEGSADANVPYGYQLDTEAEILETDPDRAGMVLSICDRQLDGRRPR